MRVSARAIIIKDNQLLVMDRDNFGNKYMSLPGGTVEPGEEPDQTVLRELAEETTLVVDNPRLVISEDAGEVYGKHYIFLCNYVSGEPKLGSDSIEAKINAEGKNLYTPMWLDIKDLPSSNLRPLQLRELLVKLAAEGFPDQPIKLQINVDSEL